MSDSIRIGSVQGSVFSVGRKSFAKGTVVNHGAGDVEALRAEIAKLVAHLDALDDPAVREARRRAEQLDTAVEDEAGPVVVEHSWSKLRQAMTGLGVTANLAQIGSFIQPFLS